MMGAPGGDGRRGLDPGFTVRWVENRVLAEAEVEANAAPSATAAAATKTVLNMVMVVSRGLERRLTADMS
jgi:hypothetical protein